MQSERAIDLAVRPMTGDDGAAVIAFARRLPAHDLLFLQRDIRNERVVAAWIEQIGQGMIRSIVALADDAIVGCAAVVRDPLGWSQHVAEIRVLVSPDVRGAGLGRTLAQAAFAMAVEDGAEKLTVRLVPDQAAAIALFEEMGFRAEAMLLDQVRDADGRTHDLAILSANVGNLASQHAVYGFGE